MYPALHPWTPPPVVPASSIKLDRGRRGRVEGGASDVDLRISVVHDNLSLLYLPILAVLAVEVDDVDYLESLVGVQSSRELGRIDGREGEVETVKSDIASRPEVERRVSLGYEQECTRDR